MKPRLLVVLGRGKGASLLPDYRPEAEGQCSTFWAEIPDIALWKNRDVSSMEAAETIRAVEWRGKRLTVYVTSHPYSDFAKDDASKAETASRLKRAWEMAQRLGAVTCLMVLGESGKSEEH